MTAGLQEDLFAALPDGSMDALLAALDGADRIFLKKLSLNDWQWTGNPKAHQGGVYIPRTERDSGFFPPLAVKPRPSGGEAIFEAWFDIVWPQSGGEIRPARLVNYRSKGEETHLTNVVKDPFRDVSPASFFMIARRPLAAGGVRFTALVADSAGDAVEYLQDLFRFDSGFVSGCFVPEKALRESEERVLGFVEQALVAWHAGTLEEFARGHAAIPGTAEMAALAQTQYMEMHGLASLDPFALEAPGDAVMRISRDIEYRLFRDFEVKARSMELAAIILGPQSGKPTVERALRAIISDFPRIDKVLLSAAQQRKSRAGKSFELHIGRLLSDGRIPHEVQVVIESKKRPDFVLPSFSLYGSDDRTREEALVLSAKTTLRERWKQVHGEIRNCDLYLATVDENVAGSAIEEMGESGIRLVVPESLKVSEAAVYREQDNVISFSEFFRKDLKQRRLPLWEARGIAPHIPTRR